MSQYYANLKDLNEELTNLGRALISIVCVTIVGVICYALNYSMKFIVDWYQGTNSGQDEPAKIAPIKRLHRSFAELLISNEEETESGDRVKCT